MKMTLNNAGDAVSPTPSQPLMGAGIGQASGVTPRDSNPESDWPVPSGTGCQDSDRVAAPAPIPITKNAPASEPPQERESFSSIPLARREQTLLEFKRDFARSRLQELRWMVEHHPSERWAAKLEEAELWARGLGL